MRRGLGGNAGRSWLRPVGREEKKIKDGWSRGEEGQPKQRNAEGQMGTKPKNQGRDPSDRSA